MNAALGSGVNTALSTLQGQISLSETAILGAMIAIFNGMDLASSSGRMQEAILDAQGLIDGLVQVKDDAQKIEQGVEGTIAAIHKKKDPVTTSSPSVGGIG